MKINNLLLHLLAAVIVVIGVYCFWKNFDHAIDKGTALRLDIKVAEHVDGALEINAGGKITRINSLPAHSAERIRAVLVSPRFR